MYVEISSDAQFNQLMGENANKYSILYFHTEWADPCVHMNSVFKSLADVYSQHVFLSINADKFPDISEVLDVSAVPYFVFLKDKTVIKELSGADPKGLANIIKELSADGTEGSNANEENNPGSSGKNSPIQSVLGSCKASSPGQAEEKKEDLQNRLRKLISAAPVMIFMKGTPAEPKCGFSRQLVAILREKHVRFGFFDILKDNAVRQGLKEYSDWPTYPQLYVNGELQGGLDIIKELLAENPNFFDHVK